MKHFERYGVVTCNHEGRIESFKEKQWYEEGFINGGLYALNLPAFLNENLPNKFSFEKDYLEKFYKQRKLYAFVEDAYFIDIGIPEDYRKAQNEISIEWIDKCIQS
jgi:D-glycero-alpha-D-manno-heptose 1-phosphate guanylyltransferase